MLRYKTEKLEAEFLSLHHFDPRLRAVVRELAYIAEMQFGKDLIITCVSRTAQEQIQLYPEYFKETGKPKPSGHMDDPVRAVDIRSKHLTNQEILTLIQWFNDHFKFGVYWSLLYENPGKEIAHLHCQCPKKKT
jgi:hypothetical protein